MKFGMFISLSILLVAGAIGVPCAAQAQSADTSKPPRFELETYQFGLLRKGPNHGKGTKEEGDKAQAGHMANINKMAQLGKLMAAGPMGDNGELRGIFLFKATADEARALAAEDPAIQQGRLVLELHAWLGPKGIGAAFHEAYRKDPKTKATMTRYYLALLTKGPKADEISPAETQKLQLAHMWHIRRMLDAKTFLAAGPFNGAGDLRGLFVIAAPSPEEARAIAAADPSVQAGRLAVELHPWWVAKEVWP